jgi:hypothetical protein
VGFVFRSFQSHKGKRRALEVSKQVINEISGDNPDVSFSINKAIGFKIGEMQPVYGWSALAQEANNRHSRIGEVYC